MAIKANNKEILDVKFNQVDIDKLMFNYNCMGARPFNKVSLQNANGSLTYEGKSVGSRSGSLETPTYNQGRNDNFYYYEDLLKASYQITRPGYYLNSKSSLTQLNYLYESESVSINRASEGRSSASISQENSVYSTTLTADHSVSINKGTSVDDVKMDGTSTVVQSTSLNAAIGKMKLKLLIFGYDSVTNQKKSQTYEEWHNTNDSRIYKPALSLKSSDYIYQVIGSMSNFKNYYIPEIDDNYLTSETSDIVTKEIKRTSDGNCTVSYDGASINNIQATLTRGGVSQSLGFKGFSYSSSQGSNSYTFTDIYPLDTITVQGDAKYGFTAQPITKIASRNTGINDIKMHGVRQSYKLIAKFENVKSTQLKIDHENGGSEPKTLNANSSISLFYQDNYKVTSVEAAPGYAAPSYFPSGEITQDTTLSLVAIPIAYSLTINVNTGINSYHVKINRSGKGGSTVDEGPTGYKSYTVYYGDTYSIDNVSATSGWHSATGGGSGTITGSRTYTLSATRGPLSVPRIDQEAPLDAYIRNGRVIIDDSEGPIGNITNTTDTPLNIHVSYTVTVYDSSDSEIDYDYPGSESTNNLFPGESGSCGLSGAVDCYDNDLGYYVELFAKFTFTDSNDSSRKAEDTRSVIDYDIADSDGGGSSGGGGSGGGGDPSPDPDPTPDPDPDPTPDPDTSPDPDTR